MKSSVKEGTLIEAPDSGSTVRKPNCANTTPAPSRKADAKANRTAEVIGIRLDAGLSFRIGFIAQSSRLANPARAL